MFHLEVVGRVRFRTCTVCIIDFVPYYGHQEARWKSQSASSAWLQQAVLPAVREAPQRSRYMP